MIPIQAPIAGKSRMIWPKGKTKNPLLRRIEQTFTIARRNPNLKNPPPNPLSLTNLQGPVFINLAIPNVAQNIEDDKVIRNNVLLLLGPPFPRNNSGSITAKQRSKCSCGTASTKASEMENKKRTFIEHF